MPNNDLFLQAKTPGSDGNALTLVYEGAGGVAVDETTAALSGDWEIDVTLAQTAPTPATLTTPQGSNRDLVWTWLTFNDVTGAGANDKNLTYVETEDDPGVVGFFEGGGGGLEVRFGAGTTAQQIIDAITDGLGFTAEIAPDNDGTGVVEDGLSEQFEGGADDPDCLATAADVKAAIEANPDTDALVTVQLLDHDGNPHDGSGTVRFANTIDVTTQGHDPGDESSTAQEVVDAVNAHPEASLLVGAIVSGDGDAIADDIDASLSGGADGNDEDEALGIEDVWSD